MQNSEIGLEAQAKFFSLPGCHFRRVITSTRRESPICSLSVAAVLLFSFMKPLHTQRGKLELVRLIFKDFSGFLGAKWPLLRRFCTESSISRTMWQKCDFLWPEVSSAQLSALQFKHLSPNQVDTWKCHFVYYGSFSQGRSHFMCWIFCRMTSTLVPGKVTNQN